jgi:hypothetical protein
MPLPAYQTGRTTGQARQARQARQTRQRHRRLQDWFPNALPCTYQGGQVQVQVQVQLPSSVSRLGRATGERRRTPLKVGTVAQWGLVLEPFYSSSTYPRTRQGPTPSARFMLCAPDPATTLGPYLHTIPYLTIPYHTLPYLTLHTLFTIHLP